MQVFKLIAVTITNKIAENFYTLMSNEIVNFYIIRPFLRNEITFYLKFSKLMKVHYTHLKDESLLYL